MAGSPSGASCKDPASSSTCSEAHRRRVRRCVPRTPEALNVPEFGVRRGALACGQRLAQLRRVVAGGGAQETRTQREPRL